MVYFVTLSSYEKEVKHSYDIELFTDSKERFLIPTTITSSACDEVKVVKCVMYLSAVRETGQYARL